MATTQKNLTELVVGDTIIDIQGTVHHITALEQYTEYEDNPQGDWGMRIFTNTYPAGHWPWRWKMRNDDVTVLESLHRRGLVTSTGRFASLTNEGEKLAAALNAPVRSR